MDTNTLLKQFKDECEVVEFKYEYPGYVGYEQYGIITALSEKELTDKYAEILKEFSPYIVLDLSYGETRNEFRKMRTNIEKGLYALLMPLITKTERLSVFILN